MLTVEPVSPFSVLMVGTDACTSTVCFDSAGNSVMSMRTALAPSSLNVSVANGFIPVNSAPTV
jgi:hypothetical protein